jgi:hypothetical protein
MNKMNVPADRVMTGAIIGEGSALGKLKEAIDDEAKLQAVIDDPNSTVNKVIEMFKNDGALNVNRVPRTNNSDAMHIINHDTHHGKRAYDTEDETPRKVPEVGDSETRNNYGTAGSSIDLKPIPIHKSTISIPASKETIDLFDDILLMLLYSDIYYYKCNFSLIGVSTIMKSIWTAKPEIVRDGNRVYIKFDELMFDISTLKCVEVFVITVMNLIPMNSIILHRLSRITDDVSTMLTFGGDSCFRS